MNNKTQPTPEQLAKAPEHNLPKWSKCEIVIDTTKETPLHRFIYEYDDSDGFKSDWFMHRLELLIKDARKQVLEEAIAICNAICDLHNTDHGNGYNRAALDCEKKIKELLNDK